LKICKLAILIFIGIHILLFCNLNCSAEFQDNLLKISDIYFTDHINQWLNIPDVDDTYSFHFRTSNPVDAKAYIAFYGINGQLVSVFIRTFSQTDGVELCIDIQITSEMKDFKIIMLDDNNMPLLTYPLGRSVKLYTISCDTFTQNRIIFSDDQFDLIYANIDSTASVNFDGEPVDALDWASLLQNGCSIEFISSSTLNSFDTINIKSSNKALQYGYIEKAAINSNGRYEVSIFNKNGTTVYPLAQYPLVNGGYMNGSVLINSLIDYPPTKLIRFDTNDQDEMYYIATAIYDDSTHPDKNYELSYNTYSVMRYNKITNEFGQMGFKINENTEIYFVQNDGLEYEMKSMDDLVDGYQYKVSGYNTSGLLNTAQAIVIFVEEINPITEWTPTAIVDSVVVAEDAKLTLNAYLIGDKKNCEYVSESMERGLMYLKEGDVIRYEHNTKGNIDKIVKVFSPWESTSPHYHTNNVGFDYSHGILLGCEDGWCVVSITLNPQDISWSYKNIFQNNSSLNVFIFHYGYGFVEQVKIESLTAIQSVPQNTEVVVIYYQGIAKALYAIEL